jgi:hypothetical protein
MNQKSSRLTGLFLRACLLGASLLGLASASSAATSAWVFYDSNGNLQYQSDANGNRIIDFSSAGYQGGGVAIPDVAPDLTVSPSGGDDTTAIQNAIGIIASMTPDANGFRGAVLLKPGTFKISAPLKISTSGVVLTGSGSGAGGTVITLTGSPFRAFSVGGTGSEVLSNTVAMTDAYVPAGTTSFAVASTAGFAVGDTIEVHRPVTTAWIHLLGMDKLVRDGAAQTWISAGSEILTDRVITAISGNRISIDAPLTDNWDSTYLSPPGGKVSKTTFAGRISKVGVEHFSIVAPSGEISGTQWGAFGVDNIIDSWVRDIRIQDTQNSVNISSNSKRVTIDNLRVEHTYRQSNSAAPGDFSLTGTQLLANNCSVSGKGNTWPFISQARVTGPIVLLKCFSDDRGFGPHQRWATGLLCDLSNFPNTYTGDKTGVAFANRGNLGSGHGWTTGWSVAWNVTATTFCIQQPPGSQNWAIGCVGTKITQSAPGGDGTPLPNGIFESLGTPVTPGSLYLAQLKQRLGVGALNAIGYADVDGTPFVPSAAAPTFNPGSGTYNGPQSVTITTATLGASIRYTLDGNTPSSSSGTVYSGPVSVASSAPLKAIAFKSGLADSPVSAANYTILPPDFTLALTPAAQSITAGTGTSYTATISPVNGFAGTVTFAISGLPAGATSTFSPASIFGSGSSTLSITTTTATAPGTYAVAVTASSGSLSHTAGVSLEVKAPTSGCVTALNNAVFTNTAFASKTGTFTATFDARPTASPINSVMGLSKGAQTAFAGFAAIARFNPSGNIDARNGSAYAAAATIPYVANKTYHFRLVINITAHTYSVFVTPAGASEITVGANFKFRTEQATVTSLNNWGVEVDNALPGSNTVCSFAAP